MGATVPPVALYAGAHCRQTGIMDPSSTPLHNLGPLDQLRAGRLPERLLRLLLGLWIYGLAVALLIQGTLGAAPWDVFHLGLALHLPLSLGTVMVIVSIVVLLAWIPLRQMPGLGTLANTLLVGPFADLNLAWLPLPGTMPMRVAYVLTGTIACALATALYVGAHLGPGPRDGVMTGLSRRSGWSIRRVRTGIELGVLGAGISLGGTVGAGTLVFALGVGPLTQLFLRHLAVRLPAVANDTARQA